MRNNSMELLWILASGSGGDVLLKIFYLELWRPYCSVEQNLYAILEEGIMGNIHVKLFKFEPVVWEMSIKETVYGSSELTLKQRQVGKPSDVIVMLK